MTTPKQPWYEPNATQEVWLMLEEIWMWHKQNKHKSQGKGRIALSKYFSMPDNGAMISALAWVRAYGDPSHDESWTRWKKYYGHEVATELRDGDDTPAENPAAFVSGADHPMTGKMPWDTPRSLASDRSQEVWALAQQVWEWRETAPTYTGEWGDLVGHGYRYASQEFGYLPSTVWQNLIKFITKHGEPMKHEGWRRRFYNGLAEDK